MIYTNLLIFLVAIFLFSMNTVAETPILPGWAALIAFLLLLAGFDRIARHYFRHPEACTSAGYFKAEKKLTIVALVFFLTTLYLCDAKYYLAVLSFGNRLPAFVNVSGLSLFLLYLALMWRVGRSNYRRVFGRNYSAVAFIVVNIKANLPIVLPWVVLSLLNDLATLIPSPALHRLLASEWGDLAFFVLFLFFVLLLFPPLVRRLWDCRELPEGALKRHLTSFCEKQGFTAGFYLWPLFEGQALTAGV
ncbi:MAG: peptidase M48 Ste24p, partial [Desulfoprunum sp.]|nr:peptidase M48 Ste24p [Desulfoprunum sp.]